MVHAWYGVDAEQDGASAYSPWIHVVRSCLGNFRSCIEGLLNSAAPHLAELLPEISQAQRSAPLTPQPAVPSSES
jgi:hypothetical protein